jgi:hypothetical protein
VNGNTDGISPKVKVPATAITALGVLLVVVGVVLGGDDGGTIRDIGLGLVGGGPVVGVIGYRAPTGKVQQ